MRLTPSYQSCLENVSVLEDWRYPQHHHQLQVEVDGLSPHQEEGDEHEVVEEAPNESTELLGPHGLQGDDEHDVETQQSK